LLYVRACVRVAQMHFAHDLVDVPEPRGMIEELELGAFDIELERIDAVDSEAIQEIVERVHVDLDACGAGAEP
jgi:hypothetical protein